VLRNTCCALFRYLTGLFLSPVPAPSLWLPSNGVTSVVLSGDVASSSQTPAPLSQELLASYINMSWLVEKPCCHRMHFVLNLPIDLLILVFLWHHRCWPAYKIRRLLLPPRPVLLHQQCLGGSSKILCTEPFRADLRLKILGKRFYAPYCSDNRTFPGALLTAR
jgi:hypothetical protein